jgi:hypothetical protein
VIAVPVHSTLADRLDAVELLCRTALDEQARHWPEDRNDQLMDLATDVLGVLGDRSAEVPKVPGAGYEENPW